MEVIGRNWYCTHGAEVMNRVLKVTQRQKGNMVKETGVGSTLSDDEIKYYLVEVMEEIKSKRLGQE